MLRILFIILLLTSPLAQARTSLSLEAGAAMLHNDSLTEKGVKPLGLNYQLQYGLTSSTLEFGVYLSASNVSGKVIHDSTQGKLSSKSNSLGAYMLVFKSRYHFELALGKADFTRQASSEFTDSQEQAILNIYDLEESESSIEMRVRVGFFIYQGTSSFIYTRFSASHYKDIDSNEFSARIGFKFLFK